MNIKNQKLTAKILTFLLSSSFFGNMLFADGLDVTASLPSGTYDKIIKVELTPTDTVAKTFYSFNPNGGPNDAMLYTGAITISKSTPLVFFSYTSMENETKIKQNDYIIKFTNDIRLGTGATFESGIVNNLTLNNIGENPVDISLWEVRNDAGKVVIPDGTIISPNGNFGIVGITGTGIISLFSPNEEKKDFIEVIDNIEVPSQENQAIPIKKVSILKSKPKVAKIKVQSSVAFISEPINNTTTENNSEPTANNTEITSNTATGNIENPISTEVSNSTESASLSPINKTKDINSNTFKTTTNKFNNSLKSSVADNGNSNSQTGIFIIVSILGIAVGSGIGMKIYKKS